MKNTALLCVTHDPSGKNISFISKHACALRQIYSEMFITVSEETDKNLVNELEKSKFKIRSIPKKGAAHARRQVLELGLNGTSAYFHYCDFDRLLTWIDKCSDELKTIADEIPKYDYLILGRTERTLRTHPVEWIDTERITNRIFSIELGKEVGVTAGSCGFSRQSAELILENSKDEMTDAEWPMIVYRIGNREVNYKAVEGLEYRSDINGVTRQVDESEKWFARLKLSYIISESARNTGK